MFEKQACISDIAVSALIRLCINIFILFWLRADNTTSSFTIYPFFLNVGKCLSERQGNIGVESAQNLRSFFKDHHSSAICSTILIRNCNNEIFGFFWKIMQNVFKIDRSKYQKNSFLYHFNVFCMMMGSES